MEFTPHGQARPWVRSVGPLGGVALVGLLALTWVVMATGSLGTWDDAVRAALAGPHPALSRAADLISFTASAPVGYLVLAVLGIRSALRPNLRGRTALVVGLAAVALGGSVHFGKLLVGRPRPRLGVLPADPEPSFPSGHTTTAVVVVGVGLFLFAAAWTTVQRSIALVAYAGYAGLVGVSRLVLGVHWLSDVIAGWLLGTVIVSAVTLFGLAVLEPAVGLGRGRTVVRLDPSRVP